MLSSKNRLLIGFLLSGALSAFAQTVQTYNIDSLKHLMSTNLNDTSKILVLNNLGRNIANSDTTLVLAEQAITLSRQVGFVKGEAEAYNNIAYWFNQKGNYPRALESYLHAIQLSEKVNYEAGLRRSFNSISTVYLYLKNYTTSIGYARKARQLSIKGKDYSVLALSTAWLSKAYLELHQTDSALKYAQESYVTANIKKEPWLLYFAMARLGEVHAAERNFPLAVEYLRISLQHSKTDGRFFRIAAAHQQLASVFQQMGEKDSCLWHAKQTFTLSQHEHLTATLLSSSLMLSALYEDVNDRQSLFYHKLALAAQDSLYSQQRNEQVQALNFDERMRQLQMEAVKKEEEKNRKDNLQYGAIALGLVLFVITFLLLSHSIIASATLIKFLGILALLIVVEFINLLLGPYIASITNNSPLLMLVMMVCIAALLIPIHSRLEKLVTDKLVEKNKKIRLQAAKRIIATLESNQAN
jgi:tetratricopeptide (TPR) repeat protein